MVILTIVIIVVIITIIIMINETVIIIINERELHQAGAGRGEREAEDRALQAGQRPLARLR